METKNVILIATGGYLNEEIRVEEINITSEDEEFDTDEFDNFEEYAKTVVQDSMDGYEQGFSNVIAINKIQVVELIDRLKQIK